MTVILLFAKMEARVWTELHPSTVPVQLVTLAPRAKLRLMSVPPNPVPMVECVLMVLASSSASVSEVGGETLAKTVTSTTAPLQIAMVTA